MLRYRLDTPPLVAEPADFGSRRSGLAHRDAAPATLRNLLPFRADRPGHAVEGAGGEFGDQKPRRVDRSGHAYARGRNALEAELAVVRLVADQKHQPMALP